MALEPVRDAPPWASAGQLTVEAGDGFGGPHVVVSGELDASTATALAAALVPSPEPDGGDLVVDFRKVSFCDVAGLNVLAEVGSRLRRHGRRLVVYGPCASLEILLDLAGSAAPVELTPAPPS
ncbi:STAS domain-containing protein [Georgenia sp. H159]|uniref:STAS domain-containing protein n=1 Tax=Georgenia sp. H159 TaxID=3076115 RepID=UPI002D771A5E|nr:STAS domain-containing protein [Georgenia sp. H159]